MKPASGHRLTLGGLVILLVAKGASAVQTKSHYDDGWRFRIDQICPVAVDDSTNTSVGDSIPWTHDPRCVVPELSEKREKLCLFTSSVFNNNRGISLLTTPEAAASVVNSISNPIPAWQERAHLSREENTGAQLAYEIRPVPEKGTGVVATRDIKQFEVFMVAFPALIVDDVLIPKNKTPPVEGPALFDRGTEQLGDPGRVLALTTHKEGNVVQSVILNNAFGLNIVGRGHKALYPEVARINHGCDPNAVARSTASSLSMRVIATRDIPAGEEIQISYIPLGLPSGPRALALARQWGFHCGCSLCMASFEEKKKSDTRRDRIAAIQFQLEHESPPYEEVMNLTDEFLDLVAKERIVTQLVDIYLNFMNIFFEWGDANSAIKYGELALHFMNGFGDGNSKMAGKVRLNVQWLMSKLQGKSSKA